MAYSAPSITRLASVEELTLNSNKIGFSTDALTAVAAANGIVGLVGDIGPAQSLA